MDVDDQNHPDLMILRTFLFLISSAFTYLVRRKLQAILHAYFKFYYFNNLLLMEQLDLKKVKGFRNLFIFLRFFYNLTTRLVLNDNMKSSSSFLKNPTVKIGNILINMLFRNIIIILHCRIKTWSFAVKHSCQNRLSPIWKVIVMLSHCTGRNRII